MTASPATVSFKVCLQRPKEDTVFHRFTGRYTLAEFQSVINHLWGGSAPEHLGIEYLDGEGDRVRLGTAMEWDEAVRLWAEEQQPDVEGRVLRPLRVFVRRMSKKERRGQKNSADLQSPSPASGDSEGDEDGDDTAKDAAVGPQQVPKLALPSFAPQGTSPSTSPVSADQQQQQLMEQGEQSQAGKVNYEEPELVSVVDLLSLLFECNAAESLYAGESLHLFQGVVSRVVEGDEVHLDIDRQALYHAVVRIGNGALDQKDYTRAESVYRCALQGTFTDNMLLEYNLACALALQGESKQDDAIAMLSLAVDHGYDSMKHMARDPDLASLHGLPAFSALCGGAVSNKVSPRPVVVTQPSQPTSQVKVRMVDSATNRPPPLATPMSLPSSDLPTPTTTPASGGVSSPVRPLAPSVQSLLSVFPNLTVHQAEESLRKSAGNLPLAVNTLLNNGGKP